MESEQGPSSDEPALVAEIEVYQDKLIGKKWRRLIAVVHRESSFGRARMEMFASLDKAKNHLPVRTVLLTECVSMRAASIDGHQTIRIQLKDDTSLEVACKDITELTECLSKIAFPKKYVKISSTMLDSPSSEDDELVISDRYPVILKPSTLTRNKKLAEGNYLLEFSDDLLKLKNGDLEIQAFDYTDLIWIAAGENCLGFEFDSIGIYEFICPTPLAIIETFRCHIRFANIFSPIAAKTMNKYNRTYYPCKTTPLDTPGTSNHSTLESKLSSSLSKSSISTSNLNTTIDSALDVSFPSEEQESKRSRIFGFLRRNSKKKKPDAGRALFEENANSEWLRYSESKEIVPRPRSTALENIDHTKLFKDELERTIAQNKVRRDNPAIVVTKK